MRAGVASAVNCAPEAVLNQPSTSTATLTDPTLFQIDTVQLPLTHVTGTMTRLGRTACAAMLRFDAFGFELLPANDVSTVEMVGLIAVRLNATALTPAGTGLPEPFTAKVNV